MAAGIKRYKDNPLPMECPPPDAQDAFAGVVLRLVTTNPPTADDFRSGRSEGKKKPQKCDDCTWCACSVWLSSTKKEVVTGLTKLANHKNKKFIAYLDINPATGKTKPHEGDGNHIRLWMYENFDPAKNISKVEPI